MSKPAHKRNKSFGTLKEFAAALKCPIPTLQGWTRHAFWRWPKKAPWPTEITADVLNWAADELERGRPSKKKTDPDGTNTIADLREEKLRQEIRKLRAHADQAETELAKERGDLHDAGACEDEAVRRATLYRNGIQNVPVQVVSLSLSHGMPHEAAPAFQKEVEELLNACLRFTASSDKKPKKIDRTRDAGVVAAGTVDAL